MKAVVYAGADKGCSKDKGKHMNLSKERNGKKERRKDRNRNRTDTNVYTELYEQRDKIYVFTHGAGMVQDK